MERHFRFLCLSLCYIVFVPTNIIKLNRQWNLYEHSQEPSLIIKRFTKFNSLLRKGALPEIKFIDGGCCEIKRGGTKFYCWSIQNDCLGKTQVFICLVSKWILLKSFRISNFVNVWFHPFLGSSELHTAY